MSKLRPAKPAHTTQSKIRVPVERVIDHCWMYLNGIRQSGSCHHASALENLRSRMTEEDQGFIWLSLSGPSEEQMHKIATEFGVHPLIVEDVVGAYQRPKVERYDDQLFMVIRSVQYSDFGHHPRTVQSARQVIETGEMQIVVGDNFVITIRHNTSLPDIDDRINDTTTLAKHGPMSIAWAIADVLVDDYVFISTELADDVDYLEEEVFTPGARINVDQIYLLKREVLEMRHAIDPLDPALKMMIAGNKDILNKQMRSYFRDVLDHEIRVKDDIASHDERLMTLIKAAETKVSIQQNADMRAISAYVGMAAVPTLIAGIYGMNFDNMPELHYRYGYYVVLFIIVTVVCIMWWWFHKQKWL
ncbi:MULTISPECIES: magnesium and cobalt transport protein CorA [unclassified Corynebacterium]|uniref:magnesium and cobalt transport protein CorA n=1 Tax=unclassified Corynebacterium TaxID=2624378 RepID=UPI0021052323|nr:magnesium and cobalt transport protein CorA [Corynebacterium sp. SY003]